VPAADDPDRDRVEIGVVARAHGIRGEVVVVTHDPASETLAEVDALYIAGRRRVMLGARATHNGWLVVLDGVATRDDAEALRGASVAVERAALALGDDEFLLGDLIGCRVVRADGAPAGVVVAIDTDLQPRLIVHDGGLERMVPLVDALVPAIDLESRVVTVAIDDDWPSSPL
jgi:16S rRNA processing protein RimM